MQRNLTFQPITMPYFKYADISTTKKLDNKIKTLKYGRVLRRFPDIYLLRILSGDWNSVPHDSVAIFRLVENGLNDVDPR